MNVFVLPGRTPRSRTRSLLQQSNPIMKVFSVIGTAFAIYAYIAAANAIPVDALAKPDRYDFSAEAGNTTSLIGRADDEAEWTLVVFGDESNGQQCGGTGSTVSGGGQSSCVNLPFATKCVNAKLTSTTLGITCEFKFDTGSCPSGSGNNGNGNDITLVDDGNASNSQKNGQSEPSVKFVQVNCNGK